LLRESPREIMPRKQRFKPSRKPKPVEESMSPMTAEENAPPEPSQSEMMAGDQAPTGEDVSGET
jgi:hypothetical protein